MRKRIGAIALASGMLILGGCGTAETQTDLFEQQGTYLGITVAYETSSNSYHTVIS
ncbi:hypothetical protein [Exiguobacterium sp. PHA03]|uniref:hypothetical protein n=1 Tax=Exiguobacterium sp. PHA03 TaxID=3064895 RepID=UPI0035BF32F2